MKTEMPSLLKPKELMETIWPNRKSRPSFRWLGDRMKNGDIPFVKIGRFVFLDPVDVVNKLKNHTASSKSEKQIDS